MNPRSLSLLLLALIPALCAAVSAAEPKPNILLILSDDHSVPHLGAYGNKDIKTPNLDKFAAEGMRFDRAYVTCPQCVPSRASIMTGRSPVSIAMTRFSAPLPREIKTYPEALRAQGWFTGVCGRSYHLDGARLTPEAAEVFEIYFSPTRPMFEFFDLENDPNELINLTGKKESAATEHELKAALQEWMILQRDFLPLPLPPRPGAGGQ